MNPPVHSNYETLYGVHLLDDLHNYFPALLYDSSEFHSVQSVLRYVQQQTRSRFDLFSYGLREYLSTSPQQGSSVPLVHRTMRASGTSVPLGRPAGPSTFPVGLNAAAPPPQTRIRPITVDINLREGEEDQDEEEDSAPLETALSRALLNLLQVPAGTLTRDYAIGGVALGGFGGRGMDQFLQPVVVRPTAEQIEANTTLGNLVSDTEHACAICQDALTSDQEGRKLNACGHWFHTQCIDTWLSGNVHCPVCRHDIRERVRQTNPEEESSEDR
jgi:hypothetical protein